MATWRQAPGPRSPDFNLKDEGFYLHVLAIIRSSALAWPYQSGTRIASDHRMGLVAEAAARGSGGFLVGKILAKRYVVLEEAGLDEDHIRFLVYDMNTLTRVHLRVPTSETEAEEPSFELVTDDGSAQPIVRRITKPRLRALTPHAGPSTTPPVLSASGPAGIEAPSSTRLGPPGIRPPAIAAFGSPSPVTSAGAAPTAATGAQPTGAQPTGAQPTGAQPTGAQPTGAQPTALTGEAAPTALTGERQR